MNKNNQYKNPPVSNVVCELYFSRDIDTMWNSIFVGNIYNEIKDTYPSYTDKTTQTGKFDNSTGSIKLNNFNETEFSDEKKKRAVSISEHRMEFSSKEDYLGWDSVKSNILVAISAYVKSTNPKNIERLALRYVNKIFIPLTDGILKEDDYFNIYPQYDKIGKNCGRFDIRMNFYFEDNPLNFVMIALPVPQVKEEALIILDLGYYVEGINTLDINKIGAILESAHSAIEEVFEKTITDKLRKEVFSK